MSDTTWLSGPLFGFYVYEDGSIVPSGHNSSAERFTLHKDPTVRRIKPQILRRNRTARTTYQEDKTDSIFNATGYVPPDSWPKIYDPYSYYENAGFEHAEVLDVNVCDGKLRGNIKDGNTNFAQSCAEYRQTCSMFANLAKDVYSAFRSLRRDLGIGAIVSLLQNPKGRVDKAIANRWLEIQYGWKPLISDLHEAATLMSNKARAGFDRYTHASSSGETRYQRSYQSITIAGNPGINRSEIHQWQIRASCVYTVSEPGLAQLSSYGITNPADLIWELIPYSFVIDWMIPVGDYLASLDALIGVSNLQVYRSYRYQKDHNVVGGGGSGRIQLIKFVRTGVDNSLALPRLSYRPSSSYQAVLNGLALLRQLRG